MLETEINITHEMARVYYKLLTKIDWQDDILIAGLSEGLNKFLSNSYLNLNCFHGKHKYHKTHFVSLSALNKLEHKDYSGLVFEHIVPKQKYIQKPCEEYAAKGSLTIDYIHDLLNSYWLIATISKDEDASLLREMPYNWDGKDVFARYKYAKIELKDNPFFHSSLKN